MWKLLCYFLFSLFSTAYCQTVDHVRLIDHNSYIQRVVEETVGCLEDLEWSTLKLPDFEQQIDEEVFEKHITGSAEFRKGFVVSIQFMEIDDFTIQQTWTSVTADSGHVDVQARLTLKNIGIGYDVHAHLMNADRNYTALLTFEEVYLDFSIIKDLYTDTLSASITPSLLGSSPTVDILPKDYYTGIIQVLINSTVINEHIVATWGSIVQPIAQDVVHNRVEFPRICYNCPVVV